MKNKFLEENSQKYISQLNTFKEQVAEIYKINRQMVESLRCLENENVNPTTKFNLLTVGRNEHGNPKACESIQKGRQSDNTETNEVKEMSNYQKCSRKYW